MFVWCWVLLCGEGGEVGERDGVYEDDKYEEFVLKLK